jgi:hypothetical protein
MILEAMSTPVECEKARSGLSICRTTAVAGPGVQLAYPPKLPKWLMGLVTRVTPTAQGFGYDRFVSAGAPLRGRDRVERKRNQGVQPEEATMLWTIFVILLVLWLLGVVTSYTLGGFIHVLLVVAVVLAIMQLLQGRRAL